MPKKTGAKKKIGKVVSKSHALVHYQARKASGGGSTTADPKALTRLFVAQADE